MLKEEKDELYRKLLDTYEARKKMGLSSDLTRKLRRRRKLRRMRHHRKSKRMWYLYFSLVGLIYTLLYGIQKHLLKIVVHCNAFFLFILIKDAHFRHFNQNDDPDAMGLTLSSLSWSYEVLRLESFDPKSGKLTICLGCDKVNMAENVSRIKIVKTKLALTIVTS